MAADLERERGYDCVRAQSKERMKKWRLARRLKVGFSVTSQHGGHRTLRARRT